MAQKFIGVRLWWLNIYFRFFINRRYLELIHVGSVSHLKCDTEIKFDFTFIQMTTIDDSSSISHWSHGVIFGLVGICCGHWSDSLMNWRIYSLFLLYTAILKPDFDLKYFLFSWISFEKKQFWKSVVSKIFTCFSLSLSAWAIRTLRSRVR